MNYTYKTISSPSEAILSEKNSKFLGFAFPVEEEENIKVQLQKLKELHRKANHHCFAFRLGLDNNLYRANDDGEPSGSAGRPILGQIDSFELTNVLVVVVRYFGGTKLGVSGLISAYKKSAQFALENATIITKELEDLVTIHCAYTEVNDVMNYLKRMNIENWEEKYNEQCHLTVKIVKSNTETLISWLESCNFTYTLIPDK